MVIAVAAIVVIGILSLPPPPPSRSESINVHESDIGPGWSFESSWTASGGPAGLIEDLTLTCGRDGVYGGQVTLQSTVWIFSTNPSAVAYYDVIAAFLSNESPIVAVSIGEEGAFADRSTSSDKSYVLLFHKDDVIVRLTVTATGLWEDLSGRPFSATDRFESDFFTLARAMAGRI